MNPPDSREWVAAKVVGDRAELAVAAWFKSKGFEVYRSIGQAEFDLLLQSRCEVKCNRRSETSGNVAIEVAYRGTPSGILTSPADFWAFVLPGETVIVKRQELLSAVMRGNWRETQAGDNLASTVKLVPIAKLKAIKGARSIQLPPQMEDFVSPSQKGLPE